MVWSAIFMGLAMFCLGGALQYFSEIENNTETNANLTYTSVNISKGKLN